MTKKGKPGHAAQEWRKALIENARVAIDNLASDKGVSIMQTIDDLEILKSDIDGFIDGLRDDLRAGKD